VIWGFFKDKGKIMNTQQPEALRLADALDCYEHEGMSKAATELRRLHSVNAELLEALDALANGSNLPFAKAIESARSAIAKAQE
jgi:hypothetical protein